MERKAKPILFSGAMVRALLEGRKSQTRRTMKPQIDRRWNIDKHDDALRVCKNEHEPSQVCDWVIIKPAFEVGDLLWVRETWWEIPEPSRKQLFDGADTWPKVAYNADESEISREQNREMGWKLRPSIFMPRWASRITLEVTGVKAERLQDISEEDAKAEGCSPWPHDPNQPMTSGELGSLFPYRGGYACLWDDINDKAGARWFDNPWVWAYECRQVRPDAGKDQVG